tara:strand:+ start:222 stop:1262 length:1041 start_codon:yes stop_codon:yes gene_type:complete
MKILITGGSGFIGTNFILDQINKKNHILNVDKLSYASNHSLSNIINNDSYKFIKSDICDYEYISKIIFDYKPESIIHFAAESHVDRSIDSPLECINNNITGTLNLLHASRKYWNQKQRNFRFIHVSTDEVYGSLPNNGFFTENSQYKPNSPYSASKAATDHLVRAWVKTYGFPAIITNCSNNYGPFQFPEKLIPLIIIKSIDEKPLPVYGDGSNVRDWLHVDDHCRALDKILMESKVGEKYNIGGNNEVKNIEIVKIICNTLDKLRPRKNKQKYSELITFVKDRPGHDFRYAINNSKIIKYLGWEPKETFESGIKKTIQWYLNNEEWWRRIQNKTYNQSRLGLNDS